MPFKLFKKKNSSANSHSQDTNNNDPFRPSAVPLSSSSSHLANAPQRSFLPRPQSSATLLDLPTHFQNPPSHFLEPVRSLPSSGLLNIPLPHGQPRPSTSTDASWDDLGVPLRSAPLPSSPSPSSPDLPPVPIGRWAERDNSSSVSLPLEYMNVRHEGARPGGAYGAGEEVLAHQLQPGAGGGAAGRESEDSGKKRWFGGGGGVGKKAKPRSGSVASFSFATGFSLNPSSASNNNHGGANGSGHGNDENQGFVIKSFRPVKRVQEDPISPGPYESIPVASASLVGVGSSPPLPPLPPSTPSPELDRGRGRPMLELNMRPTPPFAMQMDPSQFSGSPISLSQHSYPNSNVNSRRASPSFPSDPYSQPRSSSPAPSLSASQFLAARGRTRSSSSLALNLPPNPSTSSTGGLLMDLTNREEKKFGGSGGGGLPYDDEGETEDDEEDEWKVHRPRFEPTRRGSSSSLVQPQPQPLSQSQSQPHPPSSLSKSTTTTTSTPPLPLPGSISNQTLASILTTSSATLPPPAPIQLPRTESVIENWEDEIKLIAMYGTDGSEGTTETFGLASPVVGKGATATEFGAAQTGERKRSGSMLSMELVASSASALASTSTSTSTSTSGMTLVASTTAVVPMAAAPSQQGRERAEKKKDVVVKKKKPPMAWRDSSDEEDSSSDDEEEEELKPPSRGMFGATGGLRQTRSEVNLAPSSPGVDSGPASGRTREQSGELEVLRMSQLPAPRAQDDQPGAAIPRGSEEDIRRRRSQTRSMSAFALNTMGHPSAAAGGMGMIVAPLAGVVPTTPTLGQRTYSNPSPSLVGNGSQNPHPEDLLPPFRSQDLPLLPTHHQQQPSSHSQQQQQRTPSSQSSASPTQNYTSSASSASGSSSVPTTPKDSPLPSLANLPKSSQSSTAPTSAASSTVAQVERTVKFDVASLNNEADRNWRSRLSAGGNSGSALGVGGLERPRPPFYGLGNGSVGGGGGGARSQSAMGLSSTSHLRSASAGNLLSARQSASSLSTSTSTNTPGDVYSRMKARHREENRQAEKIGKDLNGPGGVEESDESDDDVPLTSLAGRGSVAGSVVGGHGGMQGNNNVFPPPSAVGGYSNLAMAPPGVDPYLYASLPPDQKMSLHHRSQQMMQMMAQAAYQARAESVVGGAWGGGDSGGSASGGSVLRGQGSNGHLKGSMSMGSLPIMSHALGTPPMTGLGMGGMGIGMGGMGMGGSMPPGMGSPYLASSPFGSMSMGMGMGMAMPPPGSLPPFAPPLAASQPFFQPAFPAYAGSAIGAYNPPALSHHGHGRTSSATGHSPAPRSNNPSPSRRAAPASTIGIGARR